VEYNRVSRMPRWAQVKRLAIQISSLCHQSEVVAFAR
jgi:hypothetical protein